MTGLRYLRVLVATPLGEGGKGGIDRLMDELRRPLTDAADLEVNFVETRGKRHIFLSLYYLVRFLVLLGAHARRGQLDLVHVNLSSDGSAYRKLCVCWTARLLGIPYVLHLHGSNFKDFFASTGPWVRPLIASMFDKAALNIVLGSTWGKFVSTEFPTARVKILPNATKRLPLRASKSEEHVQIIFLGRLGRRKGTPDLIDALQGLRDLSGWNVVLAGDGDVEATRSQIIACGLDDKVVVKEWLGPRDVQELLLASDVLVLPSYDENLPMSVIEGMSAGLAVVTTPVGATPDIVLDGVTGLLVRPGDISGLGMALRRLVVDRELRERLGIAARLLHEERLEINQYAEALAAIWRVAAKGVA
ncbi:glycosyltransferase family 4 protein [Ramlibacter sp. MMS24-I3-19]|uniref:glycosyltransferase family 4 protein n=1 Tax=Ramlibacter sp. MMS24-I3-19 TaxID=3416606 RepID=UPI003CFDEB0D